MFHQVDYVVLNHPLGLKQSKARMVKSFFFS